MLGLIANTVFAADGSALWTNHFNAGNGGSARAIAVDTNGNAYVAGYSVGSSDVDYFTMKYSSAGALLWTNRFSGQGITALALDDSGNAYVTGVADFTGTSGSDFLTIKYSTDGTIIWTNRYNGPGNDVDRPAALAVDVSGNAYVTGFSVGAANSYDCLTIKYSAAGVALWAKRFSRKRSDFDSYEVSSSAIALANNGDVYVTGISFGGASDYDWATIKYSAAGVSLWTNSFNGKGNSTDQAYALAVDASGNAYVSGFASGASSGWDYATIKYSTAGAPLWTNTFNGPGNRDDAAFAQALDTNGNVYITGTFVSSSFDYDWATIKYSTTGLPLWTNIFKGAGNQNEGPSKLTVDSRGNVYVTGYFYDIGTPIHSDGLTIKYSSAGALLWANVINRANLDDGAYAIAVDASENVYVAGYSFESNTNSEFITIKYSGPPPPLQFATSNGSLGYANGQFFLTLTGPVDSHVVISASSNLQTWNPLSTNQLSGGVLQFTDSTASSYPRRYYQARLQ